MNSRMYKQSVHIHPIRYLLSTRHALASLLVMNEKTTRSDPAERVLWGNNRCIPSGSRGKFGLLISPSGWELENAMNPVGSIHSTTIQGISMVSCDAADIMQVLTPGHRCRPNRLVPVRLVAPSHEKGSNFPYAFPNCLT